MDHITRGIFICTEMFKHAYTDCISAAPQNYINVCQPLKVERGCDIRRYINETEICDARELVKL